MRRAVVVRRSSGRFYLLIILRLPEKERAPNDMPERALGVVFMPGKLAVRSDGVQVPVRHTDDKLEEQIRKAYQTLRRRTPGSKRYDEQRRKLARLYEKQAARRRDALHKASREIIDSGASIGVQVPAVKKMARYHKKSGWDKTVRDEAWYTFFSMLRYKAKLAGWPLHVVPRELPVWRTCSKCGAALERAPRTSAWLCPTCGHLTGKGINAARNVAAVVQYDLDEWKRLPPSSLSL